MADPEKKPVTSEELSRKLDVIMNRLDSLESFVMNNPDYTELTAFLNLAKASVGLYKEPLEMFGNLKRQSTPHIDAKVIIGASEVQVGEDVHLTIELINEGDVDAQILRVESLLPSTFELVEKPDQTQFEEGILHTKDLRLNSLVTEKVKLTVRSFIAGNYEIRPRIIHVGRTRTSLICEPEPAAIKVVRTVLPNRISTGYMNLDSLLFGGIPETYATVLSSTSCDERDLLIGRFLKAGLRMGQATFYVSVTPKNVEDFLKDSSNFLLLLCNPHADSITKSQPNVFKAKGVENLTDINIALTLAFRGINPSDTGSKRACLEIVSDVLLQHKAKETRRWLAGVLSEFKSNGFTVLATLNPQMHSFAEAQAVLDLFDGEISIYEKETENGQERHLRIRRMHDQKYLETDMVLKKADLRDTV
ncbi:MAG: hypothetical protein NWF11_03505 [Candidatus Bathyarchaeota archaeon]|nr:hypothetical protein [Candidatus Bathyarchaeota archaeon]